MFSSFRIFEENRWRVLTIGSPPTFDTSAKIMFDPGVLLCLSEDMAFLTSWFVIMSSSVNGSIAGVVLWMDCKCFHHEEIL